MDIDIYYVVEDDNTITVGVLNSKGVFVARKGGFRRPSEGLSWFMNRKAKKKKSYGINCSKEYKKLVRDSKKERIIENE